MLIPTLATAADWLTDHLLLLIGIAVVIVGLAFVGRADVPRFSWQRVWAISGVCFAESVRRRILWIVPLAIVGLIAVVQLQQPNDEQDAIRQTTKFCLFASGLVVVLSTLILACTNLPREIENRVIFLVVTKPTTRLEVVLGKVVGFARVSFVILLAMGLFTWGYLQLRSRLLTADLRYRLDRGLVEQVSIPTFRHYVDAGLLNAKTLADPSKMDIFGRPPAYGSRRRYLNTDGYLLVPFILPQDLTAYFDPQDAHHAGGGLTVSFRVGFDPAPPEAVKPGAKPAATKPAAVPAVVVQVFDPSVNAPMSGQTLLPPVQLTDPTGKQTYTYTFSSSNTLLLKPYTYVYVALSPGSVGPSLWVEDDPAAPAVSVQAQVGDPSAGPVSMGSLNPQDPADPSKPGQLTFTGREGTYGQQVKGDANGAGQTCVYRFRGVNMSVPSGARTVPVEMRVGVEKGGEATTQDLPTDLRMTVTDTDGKPSPGTEPKVLHPENNRPLYTDIPADLARTGDFDVTLQCLDADQWVGLKPTSLSVVRSESSFAWNLTKSLTVLWLLSVLVTAISVFCSTFLTWPTAVVFTLVLLLGRWALNELGDAASAGLGRQFVTEFGVRDVAVTTAVASSVDLLNKTFKNVASVLPDISAFSATDDIDRGISIPVHTLFDATWVLVGFGLPLTVAAYVILKNKEVAP
jgi:hypothetical protein